MKPSGSGAHRGQVCSPNHKQNCAADVLVICLLSGSASWGLHGYTDSQEVGGGSNRATVLNHLPHHCLPVPIFSLVEARGFLSSLAVLAASLFLNILVQVSGLLLLLKTQAETNRRASGIVQRGIMEGMTA